MNGKYFSVVFLKGRPWYARVVSRTKSGLKRIWLTRCPVFCRISRYANRGTFYVLHRLVEKIEAVLGGMGIFIMVTNSGLSSKVVLDYYRGRDEVEKRFDSLKNNLFLKRLRDIQAKPFSASRAAHGFPPLKKGG
jgi:hypothetical protein